MTMDAVIRFLDKYNLPWVLLAIITWLTILFTYSRKDFWPGLLTGIWTMLTGSVLEQFFIYHKFWEERYIMVHLGELDLFLIIGPFFSLGVLVIRFLPKNRWTRYLAVLAWSGLATGIEVIAIKLQFLDYHPVKWSFIHSLMAYVLALMSALGFYYITFSSPARHKPHPE